jgi:hypothetical protein
VGDALAKPGCLFLAYTGVGPQAIYTENGDVAKTALELGVSYRTALRYLHDAGAPIDRRLPLTEEDLERTWAIFRETYSVAETSERIDRSQRTVLRASA